MLSAVLQAETVRLPPFTRHVLPNGIVLDIMPRHDVPLATVRVVIRGGVESEPPELSGIASLTAEALRRGTTTRSADQFSTELDSLGAELNTSADMQSTSLSIELLSKDLDAGLTLLLDAMQRPSFPQAEIQKLVAQRVDGVKAMKDNPGAAAADYYRAFFFGEQHPYGRPADEISYAKITREAVADYHKRLFVGRNMIVVIAGDIDPEATTAKAAAALGTIPAGHAYQWKTAELRAGEGVRVAIVNKPDATQTNFLIGVPGVERTNPDRVPLWLVNTLFGGRFTSILNDELRVNSGLTYGASSRVDQNHLRGRITINSFTKTETTGKAVDMAVSLLKRLAEQGITAEQLASAKAYVKGTYPSQRLETSDQLADVLAEIELYDLNRAEVDDLFSRIDAVTVERANEIARKYFTSDRVTFLLLGNAAAFAAEVKKYDETPVEIPISKPGIRLAQ
jgi:predicted Zn-dependent peptidase